MFYNAQHAEQLKEYYLAYRKIQDLIDSLEYEEMDDEALADMYPKDEDYEWLCEAETKCIRTGLLVNIFEKLKTVGAI